jgi:small GTP-binding protein
MLSFKGITYKFHLWDTAGQEIYRSIVPLYFRQASCAIVVFSMSSRTSFCNLRTWVDLLYSHTSHTVPLIVAGNKIDLDELQLSRPEAMDWAAQENVPLFFTSAKSGVGINELFEHVSGFLNSASNPPITPQSVRHASSEAKPCC